MLPVTHAGPRLQINRHVCERADAVLCHGSPRWHAAAGKRSGKGKGRTGDGVRILKPSPLSCQRKTRQPVFTVYVCESESARRLKRERESAEW